jgi:ABC-type polysaccharide/polyol phosphate transport system ATPase subunit
MASDVVLSVDHVTKAFRIHREKTNSLKQFMIGGRNRYDEFVALDDVSFDVREGEVFGVIGHNGSGKSTLLKCMAGILRPDRGAVHVHRRFSALLELGAGFEPELTGRDNIHLNGAILGMTRKEISRRLDAIVEFSGLEDFIDSPVKTYSSGMYVRLAFAIAINVDPSLLLVDEILAVGDVTFQNKCMEKFVEFREQGRTIVLVTHDLGAVKNMCDRAVLIEHGIATPAGPPGFLVDEYTESMLDSRVEQATGFHRRGSGAIQIERAEMLVDGKPTDRVVGGESVTFRFSFRANQPIERPVFAVDIENVQGITVTEPCTRDVGLVPDSLDGSGVVEITIPSVPLLPGPYNLNTEITGYHRGHVYDHIQGAIRFDVIRGAAQETTGLVTVNPSWRIQQ